MWLNAQLLKKLFPWRPRGAAAESDGATRRREVIRSTRSAATVRLHLPNWFGSVVVCVMCGSAGGSDLSLAHAARRNDPVPRPVARRARRPIVGTPGSAAA